MGLQFIYGKTNTGKTQYVLNKAQELYDSGKPFIMVVPEQYTHLAEKKLISKIGSIEQGRAEVLSFDRIATKINKLYDNNKKKLSKVAKTLILSEIISDAELKYYTNASGESGFVDSINNEISELKKYNITCDDVEKAIETVNDKALKLKLEDIHTIYSKYEKTISTVYADSDDSLGILADNLEEFSPYSGYTFIFDEFSSFNPNEKDIIKALIKQSDMTFITFCVDFSKNKLLLFKPTADMAKSIENICESIGVEIYNPVKISGDYYESEDMKFLENNLYSYPSEKYEKNPENIYVNVYDNPYSEISGLASQINNIIKNQGLRYKDIRVICSDISSYSHIFRNVFGKYNIPYFIDEKVGVLKHSIITSVINILDVYINNYTSEYVISYLKSAYIQIDRQSLIDVDNFITASNASKNVWLQDEKWHKTLKVYSQDNSRIFDSVNTIRENYILPLASFHDKIKGKHDVKFICEKLYDFILSIGFDKNIMLYIARFKKDNNKHLEKQYELVWKMLIEALDTLVLVMGDKKVNISQFKSYLYMSLREQKIGIIPSSVDSVTIGDIKRSKSDSTKFQFVVGAVDGKFPVAGGSNSFISDSEKKQLSAVGLNLSPDSIHQTLYERFLTYVALSGTSRSLVLSYSVTDESSNALRPSFIFTIIKNIFPHIRINSYTQKKDEILISNKTDSLEFLSRQAFLIASGKDANPIWQNVYSYYKDISEDDIHFIDSVIKNNAPVTILEKSLTDKLFNDEFYSTVSRMQRYNSCRYSYFLEYMLGLKPKKMFEPESTDIGTFVHSCIEKTFKKLEQEKKSLIDVEKDYILKVLDVVFQDCITDLYLFPDDITPKDEYVINTMKTKVINAIMGIRSHFINSSFKPLGHEITFNDDNFGCIEISLGNNKKVKLTGKIDRADYFDNEDGRYIRVVDYKTGNKVFNFTDVYHGLDVQLIVYLNALVKSTDRGHHAGALFFRIQNPIAEYNEHPDDVELQKMLLKNSSMTGIVSDDEHVLNAYSKGSLSSEKKATPSQFCALSDYVESVIKSSAQALSDGKIDINPYTKSSASPCLYCDFSKICNFGDSEKNEYRVLETVSEKKFWETITQKKDDK